MVDLHGHEAGNGGYGQGRSTARRVLLYSERCPVTLTRWESTRPANPDVTVICARTVGHPSRVTDFMTIPLLSLRNTHPANEALEARLAPQAVESAIRYQATRQPSAPVFVCSFEARERWSDFSKAGENSGDEHLRYILPATHLFQFT